MVQIGNYHFGQATDCDKPAIDAGAAFHLWNHLTMRYDIIQATQMYQNFAHDPDFKYLLTKGLQSRLEVEVKEIEKEMNILMVNLPNRPPKTVKSPSDSSMLEDRFMYRQIFVGMQSFLTTHVSTLTACIVNDPLRTMFVKFLKNEADGFDEFCKYGKLKGYLQVPPEYKS